MVNTYFSDYQAQGRYLMPALIPLMIFITEGYGTLLPESGHKKTTACKKTGSVIFTAILILYLLFFFISYFKYLVPGCLAFSF